MQTQADVATSDSRPIDASVEAFELTTLRLKLFLRLPQDKQIAHVLGLSVKAWAARKARCSFPVKELYVLKAKRPELNIDVDFLITGKQSNGGVIEQVNFAIEELKKIVNKLCEKVDLLQRSTQAEAA